MRNEWPPDAFRFIVQFGIELDGIVRIVGGTLKPVTIAEWEAFAWHRPNETQDQRPLASARVAAELNVEVIESGNAARPAVRWIAWLGVSIGVRNASIDNRIEVNALLEVVMSE